MRRILGDGGEEALGIEEAEDGDGGEKTISIFRYRWATDEVTQSFYLTEEEMRIVIAHLTHKQGMNGRARRPGPSAPLGVLPFPG